MTREHDRNTQAVMDEAAAWMVRLESPDATLEERREFVAWLKRSPVHLAEYLRTERTWADLGEVDTQRRIDIAALLEADGDPEVVDLNPASSALPGERVRVKGSYSSRALAVAASIVFALAAVLWFYLDPGNSYSTAVGEQRTIKLADGSTVTLNTGTRLRVDFSSSLRKVRLLEGEALFKVGKDATRPFRVVSDRAIAQAIGTSFMVRRHPTQTVITVIEGQVAVVRSQQAEEFSSSRIPREAVRVSAGVRASVADRAIQTSPVSNPATATAWQQRRLIFEGETLAQAVAEFNRYNELQLVLEDSNLSRERLSGVFDADQPQALVKFLESSGVVRSAQASGDVLVLIPR